MGESDVEVIREGLPMERSTLYEWLKRRPFQPFRVHVADGRTFEITRPRTNLLAQTFIKIGIADPEDSGPLSCDYTVYVPLAQITQLEPLPVSPSTESSGKG